ncbi:MAG: glycosyltransferase family 1 protein [Calditrichaeota bacterium]|nr:MAG: glycosyltransferase family 1 protein [Calditrichota bacterium]
MTRPKLAIAARGVTSAYSGPNAFISGLISGFARYALDVEVHAYFDAPATQEQFAGIHAHILPAAPRLVWDHLLLPQALQRDGIDLAIFPKDTVPLYTTCPVVPVMLDLGYFYPHLKAYKPLETVYMKLAMRYAVRRAQHIFAISEHTRQDVIRYLGAAPDRVTTVHIAPVEGLFRPIQEARELKRVQGKYDLHLPFIFYPTSISPRKNIERLTEAFIEAAVHIPHHLYLTGGRRWRSAQAEKMLRKLRGRLHVLGDVPPQDMPALYSMADFTVYPSLLEGFGLPIVEAFLCGSPVMAANVTSIPEVTGDAALLVDPWQVEALRDGLLRMARDSAMRHRLQQAGIVRARQFTWERTVQSMLDVLHLT